MKKIVTIIVVAFGLFAFSQPTLPSANNQSTQPQAGEDLKTHYLKVLNIANGLNDVDLQNNALLNLYVVEQNDEYLNKLSENFFNKKEYRKAFLLVNSVKDSTTNDVINLKAWIFKMAGDVKTSNKYFSQILNKDKTKGDVAFQLAVNHLEANNIGEAKKLITEYKSKAKDENKVLTTNREVFYQTKLTAAWENLDGIILFAENATDNNKLTANKDKIIAFFDKALKIDPNFSMAKQNKENLENMLNKK